MNSISRLSSTSAHWLAQRTAPSQPNAARLLDISNQSQLQNDNKLIEESQELLLGEEYEAALVTTLLCPTLR